VSCVATENERKEDEDLVYKQATTINEQIPACVANDNEQERALVANANERNSGCVPMPACVADEEQWIRWSDQKGKTTRKNPGCVSPKTR